MYVVAVFLPTPPNLTMSTFLLHSQYDLQWYCDGTLPSLPGGPDFPCPQTILNCHTLLDRLHLLRKMSHSSKVKLQAARYIYICIYSTRFAYVLQLKGRF